MKFSCMKIGLLTVSVTLMVALTAMGDRLRNMELGDKLPATTLKTLDNRQVSTGDYEGKVLVLLFVAGEQKGSLKATEAANEVCSELDDVELLLVTADSAKMVYFKEMVAETGLKYPLALDFDRTLYGQLGLIVLPTTVIVDREGKIVRVVSSYKSGYGHQLDSYLRHALGEINDQQLAGRLEVKEYQHNQPGDRAMRHRMAAKLLREKGLLADAENQLLQAIELDNEDLETLTDLATIYLMRNKIEQATTLVDDVLAKSPRYRRAILLNGVIHLKKGDLDEAERILTESLMLNPDPAQAHYYLGMVYEQKGDKDQALEHYRQSLKRVFADQPQ